MTQYHFVTWQDHDVPTVTSLVDFWRSVSRSYRKQQPKAPLLVHCRWGVRETGLGFLCVCVLVIAFFSYCLSACLRLCLPVSLSAPLSFLLVCLSVCLPPPSPSPVFPPTPPRSLSLDLPLLFSVSEEISSSLPPCLCFTDCARPSVCQYASVSPSPSASVFHFLCIISIVSGPYWRIGPARALLESRPWACLSSWPQV